MLNGGSSIFGQKSRFSTPPLYLGLVNKVLYKNDRGHFQFCLGCMDRQLNHPYTRENIQYPDIRITKRYDNASESVFLVESINYTPLGLDFVLSKSVISELIQLEIGGEKLAANNLEENEKKKVGEKLKLVKKFSPTKYFKNLMVFKPGVLIKNATQSRDYLFYKYPIVIYEKQFVRRLRRDRVKKRIGFRYVIFGNLQKWMGIKC